MIFLLLFTDKVLEKFLDQSYYISNMDNRSIIRQRLLLGNCFRPAALIFLFSVHVPQVCKATEKSKYIIISILEKLWTHFLIVVEFTLQHWVSIKFSLLSIAAFLQACFAQLSFQDVFLVWFWFAPCPSYFFVCVHHRELEVIFYEPLSSHCLPVNPNGHAQTPGRTHCPPFKHGWLQIAVKEIANNITTVTKFPPWMSLKHLVTRNWGWLGELSRFCYVFVSLTYWYWKKDDLSLKSRRFLKVLITINEKGYMIPEGNATHCNRHVSGTRIHLCHTSWNWWWVRSIRNVSITVCVISLRYYVTFFIYCL